MSKSSFKLYIDILKFIFKYLLNKVCNISHGLQRLAAIHAFDCESGTLAANRYRG